MDDDIEKYTGILITGMVVGAFVLQSVHKPYGQHGHPKYTKEDLLDNLRNFFKKHGRPHTH